MDSRQRLQLNAGLKDSLTTAERYLDEVVGDVGPASNATRRQAYLRGGPAMVDALLAEGIRWSVDPQPDYLTSTHAGPSRDLDAKVLDLKK
jgi:3-oxosteroid 1-dehydrogenase